MTPIELFDKNRRLAFHFAHKYCRKYPWLDFDDLSQVLLTSLWRSAQLYDTKYEVPFGAWATNLMKKTCWTFVRDNHRRLTETSLSEPRGRDESLTVADLVNVEYADAELASNPGDDRLAARLHDLREQIETLSILTDRQRDILRMFCDGIHQAEISRRLGVSRTTICHDMKDSLTKLSRVMGGVARPQLDHCQIASAWDQNRFSKANHVRHHVNRRSTNPTCAFCQAAS